MKTLYSILTIFIVYTIITPIHANPKIEGKVNSLFNENAKPTKPKKNVHHDEKKGEFGANIIAGFGIQGLPVFDAGLAPLPAVGIDLYMGYRPRPSFSLRININMTYPFIFPNFSFIPAVAFVFGKKKWRTVLNVGIGARFVPYAYGSPPLVSPILKIGVEGRYIYRFGMFLGIGGDIELQWFYLPFGKIRFTIGTYF